jgi:hypothetical protein
VVPEGHAPIMTEFKMKIDDVFQVGLKTILTGKIYASPKNIRSLACDVEVDGRKAASVTINGEVLSNGEVRDVYTDCTFDFIFDYVRTHSVWLTSK